jgi:SAM-dependent methyltransferase
VSACHDDGVTSRALSFGAIAETYERFRLGYPLEVVDRITAYADRPVATALEIGAGTGKATRVFAQRGILVTATEPDSEMVEELRKHVPESVSVVRAAFEDVRLDATYALVYAAASFHWTRPEGRWERLTALLEPGGVFASFGGPPELADPSVRLAMRSARMPFLKNDDVTAADGTQLGDHRRWPGSELVACGQFVDIQRSVIERGFTMSVRDYVGELSTTSAHLQLSTSDRDSVARRLLAALPAVVEINADITIHLARRA